MSKKKYSYIGTIRTTDNGDKYIKIEEDIELSKNTNVYLEKPDSYANYLLEKGEIDESEHAERIAKIPDWKLYNLKIKND